MSSILEALFGVAMFSIGFYVAAYLAFAVADELKVSRTAIRLALKRTLRFW